jgi:hypothetical protein
VRHLTLYTPAESHLSATGPKVAKASNSILEQKGVTLALSLAIEREVQHVGKHQRSICARPNHAGEITTTHMQANGYMD